MSRLALKRKKRGLRWTGAGWDATWQRDPLVIRITVPVLPPSLNEWTRKHWWTRHRAVEEITDELFKLKLACCLPCVERAQVQVAYYFPDRRRRDPDNYTPKFLLDGLRHAGIISEDNAGVLRLPQPEFKVDPERPRTEITIEEWVEEQELEKWRKAE